MRKSIAALPAAALTLLASGALSAHASCAIGLPAGAAASPPAPALVFVGTVTSTADGGRTASVHVDEVWTGQHIPAEVIVVGSPELSAGATSVDRYYAAGSQYLFMPTSASGPPYEDNACTGTTEFNKAAASGRPGSAIRYPPAPPVALTPVLVVAIALIPGAAALSFAKVRQRRLGGGRPSGDGGP